MGEATLTIKYSGYVNKAALTIKYSNCVEKLIPTMEYDYIQKVTLTIKKNRIF